VTITVSGSPSVSTTMCRLRPRRTCALGAALAADLGRDAFTAVTWREDSRGALCFPFAAVRIGPAGKAVERPVKAAASAEQGWWDGVLPDCWLLVE
jgi:hypothetical protein